MECVVIVVICLMASHANPVHDSDEIKEIVRRLGEVQHGQGCRDLYRSLFAKVGADRISRLEAGSDDSIAVQSAWEEVALTVPLERSDQIYRPKRKKLVWFLGFVQGRMRVAPPEWWQQAALGARANHRYNIYPGKPKSSPYHYAGIARVHCPKEASVEKNGDAVVYRVGENSIAIPESILHRDDSERLHCNISGEFAGNHCFLAVHNDVGHPPQIACIDRSTGKVVWKSKACGCWWSSSTGKHESSVSIVVTSDDRVFVFGMSSIGFYFHGFGASDGRSLVRFSNNF